MIEIRPEQYDNFEACSAAKYHQDLADFFRTKSPEAVEDMEDDALVERVSALVGLSQSYGIETPEGALAYVSLGLAAGPSFDTDSNVDNFLRMPGASPDIKIRELLRRVANKCNSSANG
jgi:hypothetical protein